MTSSARMAQLASKAMKTPEKMTQDEIRELGASVEFQRQDKSTRPRTIASDAKKSVKTKT